MLGRGCRQGEPLLPYPFRFCAEILGNMVRHENNIKGISIIERELRIPQFADDIARQLDGSEASLRTTLNLLDQFATFSVLSQISIKLKPSG